jgi:hypothetical protein
MDLPDPEESGRAVDQLREAEARRLEQVGANEDQGESEDRIQEDSPGPVVGES